MWIQKHRRHHLHPSSSSTYLPGAMPKRPHAGSQTDERPAKIARPDTVDRLSLLSDELLLRILSFVPISNFESLPKVK